MSCDAVPSMTSHNFRCLALALTEVEEHAHHGHPDFRRKGRLFATLGYPSEGWAMVKLSPEQQQDLCRRAPEAFRPVPGAWGERGATHIRLASANEEMVGEALTMAWQAVVSQPRARQRRQSP